MSSSYKMIFKIFVLLNLLTILFIGNQPASAQNKSSASPSSDLTQMHKNQPIHFSAKNVTQSGPKGKEVIVLSGHAEIFLEKDQTTITADTVWYYSADSIFKALSHVKIVKVDAIKGNMIATSRKAKFDQDKNQVTLEGNAKVTQGENEIFGDVIVITQGAEGSTMEVENATGILNPQTKPDTK